MMIEKGNNDFISNVVMNFADKTLRLSGVKTPTEIMFNYFNQTKVFLSGLQSCSPSAFNFIL